ncbi:MAG: hypothetical protein K2P94_08370 [Rhodospirillaceae bacterium]|nr:hypothetical protein [Rhodospirillaceae bacterium]
MTATGRMAAAVAVLTIVAVAAPAYGSGWESACAIPTTPQALMTSFITNLI